MGSGKQGYVLIFLFKMGDGKLRISANIVAYNEEAKIKDCLESIRNVVDEIILVHDGPCSDNTLKIARKYTKKIFVLPRWGEAEPHRPFALTKSSGEWVLTLDADERLSPRLKKSLRKLVADSEKNNISGYSFYWPFYDMGKRITKGPLSQNYRMILFRKAKASISGMPHDWFKVKGHVRKIDMVLEHKQPLDNWTFKRFFKKSGPWAKVDARYRIEKKYANHFSFWYLFKAPLWAVLYFFHSIFIARLYRNGLLGLKIAVQLSIYNFLLYWHVFMLKFTKLGSLQIIFVLIWVLFVFTIYFYSQYNSILTHVK